MANHDARCKHGPETEAQNTIDRIHGATKPSADVGLLCSRVPSVVCSRLWVMWPIVRARAGAGNARRKQQRAVGFKKPDELCQAPQVGSNVLASRYLH